MILIGVALLVCGIAASVRVAQLWGKRKRPETLLPALFAAASYAYAAFYLTGTAVAALQVIAQILTALLFGVIVLGFFANGVMDFRQKKGFDGLYGCLVGAGILTMALTAFSVFPTWVMMVGFGLLVAGMFSAIKAKEVKDQKEIDAIFRKYGLDPSPSRPNLNANDDEARIKRIREAATMSQRIIEP